MIYKLKIILQREEEIEVDEAIDGSADKAVRDFIADMKNRHWTDWQPFIDTYKVARQ